MTRQPPLLLRELKRSNRIGQKMHRHMIIYHRSHRKCQRLCRLRRVVAYWKIRAARFGCQIHLRVLYRPHEAMTVHRAAVSAHHPVRARQIRVKNVRCYQWHAGRIKHQAGIIERVRQPNREHRGIRISTVIMVWNRMWWRLTVLPILLPLLLGMS